MDINVCSFVGSGNMGLRIDEGLYYLKIGRIDLVKGNYILKNFKIFWFDLIIFNVVLFVVLIIIYSLVILCNSFGINGIFGSICDRIRIRGNIIINKEMSLLKIVIRICVIVNF